MGVGGRGLAAWTGGSAIGTMEAFKAMAITKEEYDDAGPSVVHRKCY